MKQFYFLKLNPPRPSFPMDMTPEERDIMQRHVLYWTEQMAKGVIHVFGPVLDPEGAYGVGVIGVDSEAERDALIAGDPANGLNHYEFHPMKAILPPK